MTTTRTFLSPSLRSSGRDDGSRLPLTTRLNQVAPGIIIAAILTLAAAITIGEWRDGTLGAQRIVDLRLVVFAPRSDGTLSVELTDRAGAVKQIILPSSQEGFVATLSKSLGRERRRHAVAETEPYRLVQFQNGSLALRDPALGTDVRLDAFGATNVGAFRDLMIQGAKP